MMTQRTFKGMSIRDLTKLIATNVEEYLRITAEEFGDFTLDDVRLAIQTTDVEQLIADWALENGAKL